MLYRKFQVRILTWKLSSLLLWVIVVGTRIGRVQPSWSYLVVQLLLILLEHFHWFEIRGPIWEWSSPSREGGSNQGVEIESYRNTSTLWMAWAFSSLHFLLTSILSLGKVIHWQWSWYYQHSDDTHLLRIGPSGNVVKMLIQGWRLSESGWERDSDWIAEGIASSLWEKQI